MHTANQTVFLVKSPVLGTRLIHSPQEGVIHVTSNLDEVSYLTALEDKKQTAVGDATLVEQTGEICRSGNASVHLSDTGELCFFDDSQLLLSETSAKDLSTMVNDTEYPSVRISWESASDDAIYGLGQYQDGLMNIRGAMREGHQKNLENCVPLWVSSNGFGIFCYCR